MINALKRYAAGLSVVPIRPDGSKRPAVAWSQYQQRIATPEEIKGWAGNHVGIIAGEVSGGLEVIDIDSKYDRRGDLAKRWGELVEAVAPGLMARLVVQTTVGGGYHALYRCAEIEGNQKLARRPTVPDERETEHDKVRVLIETRGEGGYILCAPTPGYKVARGALTEIPRITPEERKTLLSACWAMDEMPAPQQAHGPEVTPLDDYTDRVTDQEVVDLLCAHGWTVEGERGGVYRLRRPGKGARGGISATFGHRPGLFWVFTTSTEFEAEKGYTPAGVYAVLEHNGDFREAARELSRKGYGSGHIVSATATASRQHEETKPSVRVKIVRAGDCLNDLDALMTGRFGNGVSTGWPMLDRYYKVVKGQLTVVTGMPSHGKSEWTDALTVNLAEARDWKWCVFSPENYPVALHVEKLLEKKTHRSYRHSKPDELLATTIEWVHKHYWFFDGTEDNLTLDMLLETAERVIKAHALDGFILDPWNEIDGTRPYGMSETDFIGKSLMRIRKFSRRLGVATFIVAHPAKMRKRDDGAYPIPTLYDISGSAHWRNKADNGIVVYRDNDIVKVQVQKVKYKHNGRPGEVAFTWNREDGTYTQTERTDNDRGYDW